MRRLFLGLSVVALVGAAAPDAAAQQSVNFFIGGFTPRSLDARGSDDILFSNGSFLTFDIKDFNGVTFGGEWLVGLGDLFDAGLGVGFYQRTSPAIYTFDQKLVGNVRSEIEQDLKLRIVPVTATIRFLPLGHRGVVTPYIGGGVGVMSWRYSETGEFVATDRSVFRESFVGSGSKAGPVVLGGVAAPVGSAAIGFEVRYQSAKADLPTSEFASDLLPKPRIDLGGMNYLFTVTMRF